MKTKNHSSEVQLYNNKKYSKNVPLYYLMSFFSSLQFQRGIFILYLLDIGFSNTQIGLLQSSLFFSTFIFEIPTGYIGDKIGRKWSVAWGTLISIIQVIGMLLFKEYSIFLVLFILKGVSGAFISGAGNALLYDSLKFSGQEEQYLNKNSKINSIVAVTLGASILIGGYMQSFSWELVYGSCAIALFISLIFILLTYENKNDYRNEDKNQNIIKEVKLFFSYKKNKFFIFFILSTTLFEAVMTPYFIYAQNLFNFYDFSPKIIGFIYSIVQFSSGITFLFSEKISHAFSFKKIINTIFISSIILLTFNIFESLPLALLSFFIIIINTDILFILRDNHIQKNIPSTSRASFLSFVSFIEVLFTSLMYFIIGCLMDLFEINYAISFLSIFVVISLILIYIYFKYDCIKIEQEDSNE